MKKTLKITCIGYLDFKTGKVYSTKAELLAAKALNKCKNLFNLAVMRKWLIEAKIALLRLKAYTWKTSCQIASLVNELKAMKFGHSLICKNFIVLPYSKRKLL